MTSSAETDVQQEVPFKKISVSFKKISTNSAMSFFLENLYLVCKSIVYETSLQKIFHSAAVSSLIHSENFGLSHSVFWRFFECQISECA